MFGRASDRSQSTRELTLRAASAAVLASGTLLLTWGGIIPFAILVTAVAWVLLWEFGRLVRNGGIDLLTAIGAFGLLAAIAFAAMRAPLAAVAVLGVCAVLTAALGRARPGLLEAAGIIYVGLPAIALVWLRTDETRGLEAIIFLLLAVWATDTGAFVGGRAIGGPRLWRRISPNKTWSGLATGVLASALVGLSVATVLGSAHPTGVSLTAAFLGAVSQLGDLAESALKRAHGVKDTSDLIPGHGGFMDRVDGLLFAAVAAAIYALLVNPRAPGATLLGLE